MHDSILQGALGRSVSRETSEKLEHFADLFQKWSSRINLIAPSTKQSLWERHVADSAQLLRIVPEPKHWLDIGSGGGFPGVITAILLTEFQAGWVDLVESNHKKVAFLRAALMETGARGRVHASRIEEASAKVATCDVISARALADLDQLLGFAEIWAERQENLRCVFHKGRDYAAEVDKARDRWRFDLVIHKSAIEADSVILEITGLARKV